MPRRLLLALGALLLLLSAVPHIEEAVHAATCTGANPCKACKNCKYCAHCAKRGGMCGVCRR